MRQSSCASVIGCTHSRVNTRPSRRRPSDSSWCRRCCICERSVLASGVAFSWARATEMWTGRIQRLGLPPPAALEIWMQPRRSRDSVAAIVQIRRYQHLGQGVGGLADAGPVFWRQVSRQPGGVAGLGEGKGGGRRLGRGDVGLHGGSGTQARRAPARSPPVEASGRAAPGRAAQQGLQVLADVLRPSSSGGACRLAIPSSAWRHSHRYSPPRFRPRVAA